MVLFGESFKKQFMILFWKVFFIIIAESVCGIVPMSSFFPKKERVG